MKVLTKSFQTPPSNTRQKRHSETSCDDEMEQRPISLPTQRVTSSEKTATDAKSTISEPIQSASKKTAGSVSYSIAISCTNFFFLDILSYSH